MKNDRKQSSIINKFNYYYNKIKNIDPNRMTIYFFLVSFLVAITLYSASIEITQFRLLNSSNITAINSGSFYKQLHVFIFLVVASLLSSIFFMFLRKLGWPAVIFFVLYAVLTLYVIAVGVWTYVIIPLGFT